MFKKKNLKILLLISFFSLFSFGGVSAMQTDGFSEDRLKNDVKKPEFKLNEHNDFINKIVEKAKEEELKEENEKSINMLKSNFDVKKNNLENDVKKPEFKLNEHNDFINKIVEKAKEEELKEENEKSINMLKSNFDVKKNDLEKSKYDELFVAKVINMFNETKDLKIAYESFCRAIKKFDYYYARECLAIQKISETYSNCATEEIAKKLVVDDIKLHNYHYSIALKKLNKMFRMRDEAFIGYPYNKIEECEAKILDSLDLLKDKFKNFERLAHVKDYKEFSNELEEFDKVTKRRENKEFLDDVFNKYLIKNKLTMDEINAKYNKYIDLIYGNNVSFIGERNKKILNSDPFSYFNDVIKNSNYGINKTINYLLFCFTKLLVHLEDMDLKREEYKIFDDEYLKLMEDFKKEEINALNITDVVRMLEKEVELRKRAFEFIYRIGKKAELCADDQIRSLYDKEKSKVEYVKHAIECPEHSLGEEIRELCNSLNTPGYIYKKYVDGKETFKNLFIKPKKK